MTTEERLYLLKSDLQLITDVNDDLLKHYLAQCENAMNIEGITDDGSVAYDSCIISYAAYLFRKRAGNSSGGSTGETAMPRFLRWQMNNLLLHQKGGESS